MSLFYNNLATPQTRENVERFAMNTELAHTSDTTMTASQRQLHAWLDALRFRSLPLALSGTIIAGALAAASHKFSPIIFILMLLVAVLLQTIANFADEYGDLCKGVDNDQRLGPIRGMQRGDISMEQMKIAIAFVSALTLVLGICMLIYSFGLDHLGTIVIFIGLGIFAIAAAILYTVGHRAYGYYALGDLSSFIFFGPVAIIGGTYIFTHEYQALLWLPALGLGLPTMAVINLNNMRDRINDAQKGKLTVANLLGEPHMRIYAAVLSCLAAPCFCVYALLAQTHHFPILECLVFFGIYLLLTIRMFQTVDDKKFDSLMAPTALTTVFCALVFSIELFCSGL